MNSVVNVAIVTGGGSGIGRAVALALAAIGYNVVIAGRRKDQLDRTVSKHGSARPTILAVPTDITSSASVMALFTLTRNTFGRLDLLFNNAEIGMPPIPLEDVTYQQWRTVVDTNLTGAFLCTQEAIRLMKEQEPKGGRSLITDRFPRMHPGPIRRHTLQLNTL
jgi:NAD(P)-dependent dehydrogenase (short-subunit alcohol dehydrogenase family)